jgi:hypothetical protein
VTSFAIPPKRRQQVLLAFGAHPSAGARRKNRQPRKKPVRTVEGYTLDRDPYAPGISRAQSEARFAQGPSGRPTASVGPTRSTRKPAPHKFSDWRSGSPLWNSSRKPRRSAKLRP